MEAQEDGRMKETTESRPNLPSTTQGLGQIVIRKEHIRIELDKQKRLQADLKHYIEEEPEFEDPNGGGLEGNTPDELQAVRVWTQRGCPDQEGYLQIRPPANSAISSISLAIGLNTTTKPLQRPEIQRLNTDNEQNLNRPRSFTKKDIMSSKPHIAQTLLSRAHSPETTEALFTERIKQKPLHLRPTSPTPSDNRSRRRLHRLRQKEYFLRHQKPKPLSAREKRESGVYKLSKEECKYEIFKELNGMWGDYMREMLDLGPGAMGWRVQQQQSQQNKEGGKAAMLVSALSHGSKLVSADFHGAEMEVVRSRCAGRVGIKGIVVRDTKFTFVIVTEGDEVKTIPKEQTVFRFCLPLPDAEKDVANEAQGQAEVKKLVFELHGSQFQNRPVDRANKKFKWRNVEYL
ncbi:hypothetical protein BDV06DRAFT_221420 [Aspergillus oleicola]